MNSYRSADSVLQPGGPVAATVAEVSWVLIVGTVAVFCIVMLALLWALRRGGAAQREHGASGIRWWIVGGGFVFPVVVLSALLIYSTWRTSGLMLPRGPDEPTINVTAHLWWWEVRYLGAGDAFDIVLANEIHVPVGRAVTLGLTSADVIHSVWVPALAGKVDMLPGRVHQLRLQADRAGVFRGQCAEFCGEQHARMALHVIAHEPADFERWLQAQARPAQPPRDGLAQRGAKVFAEQRCSACHSVRGLGPMASIGPDLTHAGSRLHLAAGTLPMGEASLRDWLADPQHSKPGARMPSYERLDDNSLVALAAFLAQLR
jgi:cytochrome c oxidase subunit 2